MFFFVFFLTFYLIFFKRHAFWHLVWHFIWHFVWHPIIYYIYTHKIQFAHLYIYNITYNDIPSYIVLHLLYLYLSGVLVHLEIYHDLPGMVLTLFGCGEPLESWRGSGWGVRDIPGWPGCPGRWGLTTMNGGGLIWGGLFSFLGGCPGWLSWLSLLLSLCPEKQIPFLSPNRNTWHKREGGSTVTAVKKTAVHHQDKGRSRSQNE